LITDEGESDQEAHNDQTKPRVARRLSALFVAGITLVPCHTFDGGDTVDPDGAGVGYKVLVIR
jgi:hypothetical protein